MFLLGNTWSSPAEAIAAESHNSVQKHVVTNWDGLDAKAFAGIYKSKWVCSEGTEYATDDFVVKIV